MNETNAPNSMPGCDETQKTLHELWFDGQELTDEGAEDKFSAESNQSGGTEEASALLPPLVPADAAFLEHLTKCSACRKEMTHLQELGCSLRAGLEVLSRDAHAAMEPRITATLQTLDEAPEVGARRRIRRGFRLVFFITVVALISLACIAGCLIAMYLYRALS